MLCEIQGHPTQGQMESLRQVHAWYMTNRHALFCGPRFGKDHMKNEAWITLHKDLIPLHQNLGDSADKWQLSQEIAPSLTAEIVSNYENVPGKCQEGSISPAVQSSDADEAEETGCPSNDEQSVASDSYSEINSPDLDEINCELQFNIDGKERAFSKERGSMEEFGRTLTESSSPSSPRMLLHSMVDYSPGSFSTLEEQVTEGNYLPESVSKIKKLVHPFSSLINPHSFMANILPDETPGKQGKLSRTEMLKAWQTFKHMKSQEQQVLNKLNFLGRSGTAVDIRYSAHGRGENPEVYTQDFLEFSARHGSLAKQHQNWEENVFVKKTLQEFYQATENITPSSRKSSKNSLSVTKQRSASTNQINQKSKNDSLINKNSKSKQDFGHRLDKILANWLGKTEEVPSENGSGINLSTMVSLIDYVTDSMTCYKEKITPQAQLGFRQPSATDLTVPRDRRSSNSFDVPMDYGFSTSSVLRHDDNNAARPVSSPLASGIVSKKDMPDGLGKAKIRCSSAAVVDWRGRVQPEVIQNKWPQTIFGGHTYLRFPRSNLRSNTPVSRRPKTAPKTIKERWKTQRPSDKNNRATQAASHTTTIVDQEDDESMMQIHQLLPLKNSFKSGHVDSFLFEDFQGNQIKKYRKMTTEPRVTEYVSFIAQSATASVEPYPDESFSNVDDRTQTGQSGCSETSGVPHDDGEAQYYSADALNAAVKEDLQSLSRGNSQQSATIEIHRTETRRNHFAYGSQLRSGYLASSNCRRDNMTARVQRSAGRIPDHLSSGTAHKPAFGHLQNEALRRVTPIRTPASIPSSRTAYSQSQTRSGQILVELEHHARKTKNPAEFMSKVESLRRTESFKHQPVVPNFRGNSLIGTSLQISRHPVSSRGHSSQVLIESHHLSTKTKSVTSAGCCSRTKVSGEHSSGTTASGEHSSGTTASGEHSSRTIVSSEHINGTTASGEHSNGTTASGEHSSGTIVSSEHSSGTTAYGEHINGTTASGEHSNGTKVSSEHSSGTTASSERSSGTTVSGEHSSGTTASAGSIQELRPSEDQATQRSTGLAVSALKLTSEQCMPGAQTTPWARSVSKIGRPAAQVFQEPDPDELFQAVKIQNEAAAAVSIQRIFRGYVARNVYKSLLSEERQRREEARKAAVRIQRIYRCHVRRKRAIYNRPNIDAELVQWSRNVAETQARSCAKRETRLASRTSKISSKNRETKSRLAVIGPHVEVYSAYHPKIVGPSRHELNMAAVKIQKLIRGWLLRRKMKKLAKKAIWYGSNFTKLAHDYKSMLNRVQQQHGVDKPRAPFSIKDFNLYIDLRRRYESVFEKRSFGGELEIHVLEAFFKECDLYPSRTEIEKAIDVSTYGQASRRDKKGVTKKELMDMIFYIYVPAATGLRGTRRSTWLSPIIDGQEARQMLGSEFVEPAPLAPCIKLVIDAKRAQRQREQAQKEASQRSRIKESERRFQEDKQAGRKLKKVVFEKTPDKDS